MNPKVTPDTLEATICRTGYTKSIRPPKEITESEKKTNAAAYSYTGQLSGAEYDHVWCRWRWAAIRTTRAICG